MRFKLFSSGPVRRRVNLPKSDFACRFHPEKINEEITLSYLGSKSNHGGIKMLFLRKTSSVILTVMAFFVLRGPPFFVSKNYSLCSEHAKCKRKLWQLS